MILRHKKTVVRFMPKLRDRDVERNQVRIEQAALRLFIRQGYHGTSVRDIAAAAAVSLGNIYNYYSNKKALYVSLVRRYEEKMAALQRQSLTPLLGELDPRKLQKLADVVRDIVYSNPDYWRLMYIDVTEFGNAHFAHSFRRLSGTVEGLAGEARLRKDLRQGVNAPLAHTALYLQFFTYFLVEKLFGGQQHLGMPDDRAIGQLIRIFLYGASGRGTGRKSRHSTRRAQ
jgi:AcrR family transcriptional regulator